MRVNHSCWQLACTENNLCIRHKVYRWRCKRGLQSYCLVIHVSNASLPDKVPDICPSVSLNIKSNWTLKICAASKLCWFFGKNKLGHGHQKKNKALLFYPLATLGVKGSWSNPKDASSQADLSCSQHARAALQVKWSCNTASLGLVKSLSHQEGKEKRNKNFMLFSDHNGSLLGGLFGAPEKAFASRHLVLVIRFAHGFAVARRQTSNHDIISCMIHPSVVTVKVDLSCVCPVYSGNQQLVWSHSLQWFGPQRMDTVCLTMYSTFLQERMSTNLLVWAAAMAERHIQGLQQGTQLYMCTHICICNKKCRQLPDLWTR